MRIKEDEQERAAKKLRDEAAKDVSSGVSQESGEASQEPQEPRPEVGSIEVYFPRETKLMTNQPRQTRQVFVCVCVVGWLVWAWSDFSIPPFPPPLITCD